eukprot:4864268-Prorocentrum_lima.AAC.1
MDATGPARAFGSRKACTPPPCIHRHHLPTHFPCVSATSHSALCYHNECPATLAHTTIPGPLVALHPCTFT